MSNGPIASDQLRLFLERVERLEAEKKALADDIRSVYAEAKSQGFDTKIMREIVRLRKMELHDRREHEALLDTYKAALGMLDGTPLGTWAVQKLSKKPDDDPESAAPPAPAEPQAPEEEPVSLDDARRLGREAAQAGQPVTANPFPARDERRAAWDEAWCSELGSDGMDIPAAWRPEKKGEKKPDDKKDEK